MKDDLQVQVREDADGRRHVTIDAWGEDAEHLQEAVDYLNSFREEPPPPPKDDNGE